MSSRLTEIEERPIQEALACIEAWLPPAGMTSMPEEPIKPAQANELHRAFRTLNRAPADIEYLLGEVRRLSGKQKEALRCLYAFVECHQRAGTSASPEPEPRPALADPVCNERLADAIRALHPDPGEEA